MLKAISPRSTVTVVVSEDPAVDWDRITQEEMGLEPKLDDPKVARQRFSRRYLELVGEDPGKSVELLPAKSGEKLTRFVIGTVPSEELARIADDCRMGMPTFRYNEHRWRCFLAGVREIHDFGEGVREVPKVKVGDIEYVQPAWMRERFIAGLRTIAQEVGLLVWSFNQLTEAEIKN